MTLSVTLASSPAGVRAGLVSASRRPRIEKGRKRSTRELFLFPFLSPSSSYLHLAPPILQPNPNEHTKFANPFPPGRHNATLDLLLASRRSSSSLVSSTTRTACQERRPGMRKLARLGKARLWYRSSRVLKGLRSIIDR